MAVQRDTPTIVPLRPWPVALTDEALVTWQMREIGKGRDEMALQERQDTAYETTPIAPWRANQGRFEFLRHRHDYPDPLAAAQHEARVLAQDNAHLVRRIETMQAARDHNDTVFLPRIERKLARKNAEIARAEFIARACAVLSCIVALGALLVFLVAVWWV